jgi:hypothetical protein
LIKKVKCALLLSLILCFFHLYSYAEQTTCVDEGLSWLMNLYGFNISPKIAEYLQAGFQPQTLDCDVAQVTIKEVLYDGVWMFTTTKIEPKFPDKTIIVPVDADFNDYIAGGIQ